MRIFRVDVGHFLVKKSRSDVGRSVPEISTLSNLALLLIFDFSFSLISSKSLLVGLIGIG